MARSPKGRVAILDAARSEFAANGYDGTSIRDIAEAAGLSLSALYYYFPSKYDALLALIENAFDHYFAESTAALELAGPDARSQLDALVRHLVQYRVQYAIQSRLLIREADRLEGEGAAIVRKNQIASNDRFHAVIDAGVDQGYFKTPYAHDCVRAIIAMCNAIAMWYDPTGAVTVEELQERYCHFAFQIVQCRTRPPKAKPRSS